MPIEMLSRSLLFFLLPVLCAAKPLEIYFIDVEGGQATLFVSPSGQSMLVDTGWRGFNGRDTDRIAAAAKHAKIKEIDYVVITHYPSRPRGRREAPSPTASKSARSSITARLRKTPRR